MPDGNKSFIQQQAEQYAAEKQAPIAPDVAPIVPTLTPEEEAEVQRNTSLIKDPLAREALIKQRTERAIANRKPKPTAGTIGDQLQANRGKFEERLRVQKQRDEVEDAVYTKAAQQRMADLYGKSFRDPLILQQFKDEARKQFETEYQASIDKEVASFPGLESMASLDKYGENRNLLQAYMEEEVKQLAMADKARIGVFGDDDELEGNLNEWKKQGLSEQDMFRKTREWYAQKNKDNKSAKVSSYGKYLDPEGNVTPEFKRQIYQVYQQVYGTTNSSTKAKAAVRNFVRGTIENDFRSWREAPTQAQLDSMEFQTLLGENAPLLLWMYRAGTGALKAGGTIHETTKGLYDALTSDKTYGESVAESRAVQDAMFPDWRTTADTDKLSSFNNLMAEVSESVGNIYALGSTLGGTSGVAKGGQRVLANSALNRGYATAFNVLRSAPVTQAAKMTDNFLGAARMFGAPVYNDYLQSEIAKGFSPEEAKRRAAERTVVNLMSLSVIQPLLSGKATTPLFKDITNPGLRTHLMQTAKHGIEAGTIMGLQNITDQLYDYQEAKDLGQIPTDEDFDWKKAAKGATHSFLSGAIFGAAMNTINNHGKIANPAGTQAKAIEAALSDRPAFDQQLQRDVQRGLMTEQQAATTRGFLDRIEPYYKEEIEHFTPTERGVFYNEGQAKLGVAIERARQAEIDEQIAAGNTDPDLLVKYKESARAIQQMREGVYVKGRVISGKEMERLSGQLRGEQAADIRNNGPYVAETVSLEPLREQVQDRLTVMENPEMAAKYKEEVTPLIEERDAIKEKQRLNGTQTEADTERLTKLDEEIAAIRKGYRVIADNETAIGFKGDSADPVLDDNGNIIDGRNRVAEAIKNGETEIEVVKPVSQAEIDKQVTEQQQEIFGEGKPNYEGLTDKQRIAMKDAHKAFAAHEDVAKGYTAAAHELIASGVSRTKGLEMLERMQDGAISRPQAESYWNGVKKGTREAEIIEVSNIAPERVKTEQDAIQEPTAESVDVREQARDGETMGERDATGQVPPPESPVEQSPEVQPEQVKKTVATKRAYEGTFRDEVKVELEKLGLTREIENQTEAKTKAVELINTIGEEAALDAVRALDVKGGAAAFVYGELIERIQSRVKELEATDVDALADLTRQEAQLVNEMSERATQSGQFNAALNKIYENHPDLAYNFERQVEKYKALNKGVIPPEVEAKFRELDAELKATNEKLAEATKRAEEAEAQRAVDNIRESVTRANDPKTFARTAKRAADQFRKLKTKPLRLTDENGNEIIITQQSILPWNEMVELGAKIIEKTGEIADGVKAIVDKLSEQKWYADLTDKGKESVRQQIAAYFTPEEQSSLRVPHSVIRDYVSKGYNDIESLTKAIHAELPELTEREVRDAITGYGRTVNPNKEEIEVQIRKIKRLGRAISALEDIAKGQRPLRSGAQRDKIDAEERAAQKELREAMKDLPPDEGATERELKTALDAAKQRAQNRIDDLSLAIQNREKIVSNKKSIEPDAELQTLLQERARMQELYDQTFAETPVSAGEKRIKTLQTKLDDLLTRNVKETGEKQSYTEEEQARIDELKEEIKIAKEQMGLVRSKPLPKDSETRKLEAIQNAIDEVNRKIVENDLEITSRKGEQSDFVKAKNAELKKTLEVLQQMRRDAGMLDEGFIRATKSRLRNQIDDLQREIDRGELVPKSARTIREDAELTELRAQRDAVRAEHDQLFKDEAFKEQQRLERAKQNAERKIADLQRRLKEGDYSKKKRTPLVQDTELIRLNAEKLRLQEQYDKEFWKAELKNRTKWQKAADIAWTTWGLTRALRATGEMSFTLMQGGKQFISHPIHGLKALKQSIKFAFSEKKTEEWLRQIKSQEWYPTMKESKLALTEPNAELSAREELFVSDWTKPIWNALGYPAKAISQKAYDNWKAANPFKAFERAAVGYLDSIRVSRFLDGMKLLEAQGKTIQNNPKDYQDVADVINTMTGRSSLGKAELVAPQLAKIFFSPRLWASQVKLSTPYALYYFARMTPTARRMALSDMGKWLLATTGMVLMVRAALKNDDDPNTEVELDPRSSDFMKIKLGRKRIDPWGGTQQQLVLQTRLIMDMLSEEGGYKDSKGEIKQLGEDFKTPTKGNLLMRMVTNKLAPSASLLQRYLSTKVRKGERIDEFGQPYSFGDDVLENLRPIYWQTVQELMEEDPTALDGFLIFYAFLGGGVNVQEEKKK